MPLDDVTNNRRLYNDHMILPDPIPFDHTICKGKKKGNIDKYYEDKTGTVLFNMTTWCAYPAWLNCVITHPP